MFWLRPRRIALLSAALAALRLQAAISPEAGAFAVQTYTAKTYGANPQNWAIAQDSRGVMYFGNTQGVLEFDGVFWRLIRLPYSSGVRSLGIDARGRIYVGGRRIFGYLEADAQGFTRFVPIEVPKGDSDFLDVWNVVPTSAGVYFGTDYKIFFRSNGGQIKVWRASKRFGRIFAAYGELFAATVDSGLRRLQDDEFIAGPSGWDLSYGARLAYAPGDHPILASRQGLFNFTLSEITPFANHAAEYIQQNQPLSIRQLSGGDIAVGTSLGGLVLLDREGKLERIVRKESGLPSDRIISMYEDRQHTLWLATETGIARFVPSLSSFAEPQALHGGVIAETRSGGAIYAGTVQGAFRMRTAAGAEPTFDPVSDLHERVFVMTDHKGELLAGGDHGLYRIVNTRLEKLTTTDIGMVFDIGLSRRDDKVIYTAGLAGVRRWRQIGRSWKSDDPVGVKGQEFRTVVEDADGTVWATTEVSIWHIDFSTEPLRYQQFDASNGIPSGFKNAYFFHSHVVFATTKGLLRFSEKSSGFVPDDELGAQYSNGSRAVSIVREDAEGNVWITGSGYQDYLEKTATGFSLYAAPLIQTGADELYSIFTDPDGTCWASAENGLLYRIDKLDLKEQRRELPILLRRVGVIGQKDALYAGDAPLAAPISLQHRDDALRFDFASPFYEAPQDLEYQFQLDGNEKKWSDWSKETFKEYTNLFEGDYRFRVRVRDPHGTPGGEVTFPFKVFPPFYRTWVAYLAYVAALLLVGWMIMRWRLDALQAKNRWLEGVVEERTAEVRKERDQNEALLLNILPRPVAAELRSNGNVKPTTFDDATVCFSDFVGFTLSSEKLPAETLINALNEYFTAFDEIIGRYGLEKLKTIGDAYMFAGGLPNLRPSHAVDAVLAALEMAAVVNRLTKVEQGVNWKIRLGLYSGPVVSGVVGVRKFAFDIWGNTVNFAARMESAGQPGRVNLSETTCSRVAEFVECEPRGAVRIKEGREMEMYFAVAPKPELLQGPVVDGVPEAFRLAYEKAFGEPPKSFPAAAVLEELLNQTRIAK